MTELPAEILTDIFSHLQILDIPPQELTGSLMEDLKVENNARYKTLFSLCLVNKLYHELAYPFLYRCPHLYDSYSEQHFYSFYTARLLTSLLQKPKLAKEVRVLRAASRDYPKKRYTKTFSALAKQLLRTCDLQHALKDKIHTEIAAGYKDAGVVLLLLLSINLQVLDLTDVGVEHTLIRQAIAQLCSNATDESRGHNAPLSHVREVWIDHSRYTYADPGYVEIVWDLLKLPSLSVFRSAGGVWTRCFDVEQRLPSTTLKKASFYSMTMVGEEISTFLRLFPRLQVLDLHGVCRFERALEKIGAALRTYGRGLEKLAVQLSHVNDEYDYDNLGDLRSLSSLIELTVEDHMLEDDILEDDILFDEPRPQQNDHSSRRWELVDNLPMSLEVLAITHYNLPEQSPSLSAQLVRLMKDPKLLKLREIGLCHTLTDLTILDFEALGWTEAHAIQTRKRERGEITRRFIRK